MWRLPLFTLTPTIVLTVAARFQPVVFTSLRRDPSALARGEVWRLLSPVLVQADFLSDDGVWRAVTLWCLMVGVLALAERRFGIRRSLALYVLGALVGHSIGHLWQPLSSGCSVAGCGVLGGIAAWLIRARPPQPRFGALIVLVVGVVATLFEDIHGPPLLVGAAVGAWLLRAVPRLGDAPAGSNVPGAPLHP